MADGKYCKHCGHQETDHSFKDVLNSDEIKTSYKKTLNQCLGFKPENQQEAKKLVEAAEADALARAMRAAGNPGD